MVSSRANVIGAVAAALVSGSPLDGCRARSQASGACPRGWCPVRGPEFAQLDWQLLNFRWPEPVLHFEVFWVLHAADAVRDHEAADQVRVLHRVVQPTDPTGRRRHYVEALKAQGMHQAVQVIAHGARLLARLCRRRAFRPFPVRSGRERPQLRRS